MRRRGVGVSAVHKRTAETKAFAEVGKSLEGAKQAAIASVFENFADALSKFAEKHRDRVNADAEFRSQFHELCTTAGVDPLARGSGGSGDSFWSSVFGGVTDFYFALAVRVGDLALRTRGRNGGILPLKEVVTVLNSGTRTKSSDKITSISPDDVRQAVKRLAVLGSGIRIVKFASSGEVILSAPVEVTDAIETLTSVAQLHNGAINLSILQSSGCGGDWTETRFVLTITPLLQEGIVWVDDDTKHGRTYYFPFLWKPPHENSK